MKLIEMLGQDDGWDEDATIYVARPWSCQADAILINPSPDTTEPVEQNGKTYYYFLETSVALECLEDYAASESGDDVTGRRRCERLISYAENDA